MPTPDPAPRRTLVSVLPRIVGFLAVAVLAGVVVAGMLLPFVGPAGIIARDSIEEFEDLPREFRTPVLPVRTFVYSADNKLIATIYDENRKEVPLDKVAPIMRQAVVAIEDSRFYEHNGFDARGFVRAAITNVAAGEVAQGGSTLTMQYVKNVLLTAARSADEQAAAREDTITRKLREIRYAMALEKKLTKDEILERYLNISYYGARAYGVQAAAQRYFSKKASKLTLVEAATLAGIVQQPSRFDPTRNPRLAQERRDVVLNRMAELGYITAEQAREAKALDIEDYLKPTVQYNGCTSSYGPYACDYAVLQVQKLRSLGETEAQRAEAWRLGGYKIYTTLSWKAQKAAAKAVMKAIPPKDPSRKAVAIAMVEPGTGNVQAMAQNRTWGTSGRGRTAINYTADLADNGTNGMQAGSTFKIFTLVAALESGISPWTVINSPPRRSFTGWVNCVNGLTFPDAYTVPNSTRSGNFNMFQGAAYSVNTFFVELQRRAGVCRTVAAAEKLGVHWATGQTLSDPQAPGGDARTLRSFTLGSVTISPLTLANAYATVSAHGVYCQPRVIAKVVDRNGRSLSVPAPKCKQAISRNVADATAAILTNVVDGSISGRTGGAMTIGRDTTGKTGTIDDAAAVWFAGSTPDLAAAVWVGDPRGGQKHPMRNITINGVFHRIAYGSTLPGPVWRDSMLGALKGSEPVPMELKNEWGLVPASQGLSQWANRPYVGYSSSTTTSTGGGAGTTSVGGTSGAGGTSPTGTTGGATGTTPP